MHLLLSFALTPESRALSSSSSNNSTVTSTEVRQPALVCECRRTCIYRLLWNLEQLQAGEASLSAQIRPGCRGGLQTGHAHHACEPQIVGISKCAAACFRSNQIQLKSKSTDQNNIISRLMLISYVSPQMLCVCPAK
jgi:hypothetical protein